MFSIAHFHIVLIIICLYKQRSNESNIQYITESNSIDLFLFSQLLRSGVVETFNEWSYVYSYKDLPIVTYSQSVSLDESLCSTQELLLSGTAVITIK